MRHASHPSPLPIRWGYVFGERGAGVHACEFWRRLGATIATTGSETPPKPAAATAALPMAKHMQMGKGWPKAG
ncbi:MAG: hypothetical protein HY735_32460 [Verrucomicrobia bacterium]|nr:hypothetical protein [Verrucomicrobiota bacterium]